MFGLFKLSLTAVSPPPPPLCQGKVQIWEGIRFIQAGGCLFFNDNQQ